MKMVSKHTVAALLMTCSVAANAASVDLSVSPMPKNVVGLNQTFTVDIMGDFKSDAGEALVGGAIDLMFDESIINVMGITLNTPTDISSSLGTIDNTAGNVDAFGFATFAGVADGAFNFATVELRSVGLGTSALNLVDANDLVLEWANGVGDSVSFSATDGSVTVSAVPLPAAAWMMLSGLVGIAGITRSKRSRS